MNSTPTSKAIEPQDALIARADEQLAHAYEQIARADEELTRVSEQVAKMEREAAHPRSAEPGPQSPHSAGPGPQAPPGRPGLRALVGLPLAAGIVVAALALQSFYGGGAKLFVARWAPQLVSTPSLPPENPPLPAQPAPSTVEVAAAEAAPPQATPLVRTAPQDAAPTATAALPDHTQLLQTMARDLANVERDIEQLKANQQQMASDNSKAIEALKASQEEMKRVLARVSEQNLPKTSLPPTRPMPTLRKRERTPPQVRARPRIPREEWIYDDYW
jgi:cell division septum initiation protein DivIVA